MKIDPNEIIGREVEYVLCQSGQILLYDDSATTARDLVKEGNAFKSFCQSLDPNRCFIIALVLDHVDDELFFAAREVAREVGIHMQSSIEKRDIALSQWEWYKRSKHQTSGRSGAT